MIVLITLTATQETNMGNEDSSKKAVVDYYNKYVERQSKYGINERHISILSKAIEAGLETSHDVLEIGCGIGTQTELLIKYLKSGNLYSCDISPESIKTAKANLNRFNNLTLEVQDATDFCLSKQFDAIIMPDVIEHIPLELHARMFQNMNEMLKPDGFILIHIPNPEYLEWCHENRKEILQIIDQPIYTNLLLQNLQETDLVITQLRTYSSWVEKGDYQYIVLGRIIADFSRYVEKKIGIWKKIKYKLYGKNR